MTHSKHRKAKRPQPGGWSEAVQRRLRPADVVRISDTKFEITLPPCPDFDIEEDEVVHIWIPASVLQNSKEPIYAGSFTIKADTYEERINHAIEGISEERRALPNNAKLAHFLLTFFACEIIAKAVVSLHKNRGKNTKALSKIWSTKDINRALSELGIAVAPARIDELFSKTRSLASEMSARDLRDNVVHRLKRQHREAVRDRYEDLMLGMDEFLNAVGSWAKRKCVA